jgi:tRNA-specific 2-thiouridylase
MPGWPGAKSPSSRVFVTPWGKLFAMSRLRVLIAMSGGVDSSVAAKRLVEAGYDVVGVTLHLWDYDPDASDKGRCCAPEDQHDARRVADHLGIPHYTFDRRELFRRHVVGPFVDDYLTGRTPSPCVACNRTVKMRELLPLADRLGAAKIATGHYARVGRAEGRARLYRGRDAVKDQSYFLHMLTSEELERVLLPLGDSTKAEVRAEAHAAGLPGADKGESQELCFVQSTTYAGFVEARADGRVRPGAIVDATGRALASHEGVHRFTVGQRKGLGVATGAPMFVTRIDPERAEVVVGDVDALSSQVARLRDPVFDGAVRFPLRAQVQVRARHRAQDAVIRGATDGRAGPRGSGEELEVEFVEPVRAIAPGQIAVAYDGDLVLGGATIVAAAREEERAR